eukprot:GHVU01094916.1.p1 GENE.GHVU01094916.1~~GHVU01094916.1.p1  ORF type:complete len:219 (+),score=16.46 GHVU01094916.1:1-657(+)
MYIDPYVYMQMLTEKISRASLWILRMSICAHLYEQLRMLEVYSGCTTNIQELYVPAAVYYGLERMLTVRLQKSEIVMPSTKEPPTGYIKSPSVFPETARIVGEAKKLQLDAGKDGDKPTCLAHLARRMNRRFGEGDKTHSVPRSKVTTKTLASALKELSQKRRKVDLGQDKVQFVKAGRKPTATVTSETVSQKNVRFQPADIESISHCPACRRVDGLN